MTFGTAIRTCLRKYATFHGRASRSEYWYFILFILLGGIVAGILDGLLFGGAVETAPGRVSARSEGPLAGLFQLLTLLPMLAAGWRRMHDSGRSGLFLLYPLIVMVGIGSFLAFSTGIMATGALPDFSGLVGLVAAVAVLILIVSPLIVIWWLARPSQPGSNSYGPNPHEVTS